MQARSDREPCNSADARLAELDQEIEALSAERRALFESAGLADADRDGLRDRLRRLDEWRRLHDERAGWSTGGGLRWRRLAEDPDLLDAGASRAMRPSWYSWVSA